MINLEDYKKAEEINHEILKLAKERLLTLPEDIREERYPLKDFKPESINFRKDEVILKYEEMWCDGCIYKVYISVETIIVEEKWKLWLDDKLSVLLKQKERELERQKEKEIKERKQYIELKSKFEGGCDEK